MKHLSLDAMTVCDPDAPPIEFDVEFASALHFYDAVKSFAISNRDGHVCVVTLVHWP